MILIVKDKRNSVSGTEKTIAKIVEKIVNQGVGVDVGSFEDLELFIEQGMVHAQINGKDIDTYSTIFFRRVAEKRNLAFIISNIAAKAGIACIDKLYLHTNEPSKLKQTTFLALHGVSVPKTYFAGRYTPEKTQTASEYLGFPMVVKMSKGKKGQGVFLAKDMAELLQILQNEGEDEIFIQEFIPNTFDYRILVLGEEVACAEKRSRISQSEFRNNVYLGATEEFVGLDSLDDGILALARQAAQIADIQVAGVDIVQDAQGRGYVFEVNRAPAFTYDEKISPELNLLADYLIACDSGKKR